jgi:hypothetical protein
VQSNNCPATLSPGVGCQVSVTFTPAVKGGGGGSLGIADNAVGSPQSVTLSGVGVIPVAGLSPSSLTFPARNVGQKSAPKNTKLTNKGPGMLFITSIAITGTNSGDFSETNNCGGSVPAGMNCTISATFAPTGAGTRTASITITDDAKNGPQNVPLQGNGNASEVSLDPASINFPDQQVNTSSAPVPVTLTNTGNETLTIASIAAGGDFHKPTTAATGFRYREVAPSM